MARFTAPLVIEEIGHERWKVAKSFSFISDTGLVVDIPANFETDLASIPALAQCLVQKLGHWSQPAVVHDYLYANHRNGRDTAITRLQADDILVEGIRTKADSYGVPANQRRTHLIYGGVRLGGIETWETPQERAERIERNSLDEEIRDL